MVREYELGHRLFGLVSQGVNPERVLKPLALLTQDDQNNE